MTQKVPVIPAITQDVPLNTRRVLLAMKTTIEYLLARTGDNPTGAVPTTISAGAVSAHNALNAIQGGETNSYFHLTSGQHTDLTDGANSTLHFHDTDRDLTNHTGLLPWANVDKTGATFSDFGGLDHEDLSTFQGGTTDEHYHLTLAQWAFLLQGTDTVLHYHNSDRARSNHTGTQDHNDTTSGKQGGTTDEYYHLTSAQHTDLTDAGLTDLHRHTADDVELERIGASTYSTVQDLQNIFHSAGWVKDGGVTDNGDGTVAVAAGNGVIRATDSAVAAIKFFDFAAVASVSLTNLATNWIYIDYNAGAPAVTVSTTEPTEHNTKIKLAVVYRNGTELHINQAIRYEIGDHAANMVLQMQEVMPYAHVTGANMSESGTRNLNLTAGAFWNGLSRFTTAALNTAVSGTFSTFYVNAGAWTETTGQTQVDNTQYNNPASGLTALSANRYTNRWVYLATDSDVHIVYGQAQYVLLADVQAEGPPSSLPAEITTDSFLIGRIVVRQGTATFVQVDSAFDMAFNTASVNAHNDLSGLQGGTTGEYYHATSAEYTGTGTGVLVRKTGGAIDPASTGATTRGTAAVTSLDVSLDLTMSGTGKRFLSDFSNATLSNRMLFQTSTTNGNTSIGITPNGTGTSSNIAVFNAADTDNSAIGTYAVTATSVLLNATKTGTASLPFFVINCGGAEALRLTTTQHTELQGTLKTKGYTVATLPAAGTVGRETYVTDALAPVWGAAAAGGGAVVVGVLDTGATWVCA